MNTCKSLYRLINVLYQKLTLLITESTMEICDAVLTFKSVD